MKRLLGLLLVMGMVGCGGGNEAPPAGLSPLPATPNKPQAKADEPPVQTVDISKLVNRDGLRYEGDSETPFTGVAVSWRNNGHKKWEETYKDGELDGPFTEWHENGHKALEATFKDGKEDGPWTEWYENGKKSMEATYKDGKKEGLETLWHENGKKRAELTYKDGLAEGLQTNWHENGQKWIESTFKDGKVVSETKWDEEGNEIKE